MVYLRQFNLVDEEKVYLMDDRNIHNNTYPLWIFRNKELKTVDFSTITCFYGGNGSGKSTLLNIIAEKLKAQRKSSIDKSKVFNNYVEACENDMAYDEPLEIKIITSDDIFDALLDIRSINSHISRMKEKLSREYLEIKYNSDKSNFENLEEIKKTATAKTKTMSRFIRENIANNTILHKSNGEEALIFWEREIKEDSIYILDEPENSLSAENQLKLKKFIEESARFFNCQFIISTHSPFLLDLENAIIYDLDSVPVKTKKWSELSNIKIYHDFFKEREDEFKD